MSTVKWTNPNNETQQYDIGTEGRESFPIAEAKSIFGTFLNIARSIYNNVTGLADIIVPTYGLWAGPGWAGGQRLTDDENGDIKWSRPPCYNANIKNIEKNPALDPGSCYSIVDAMTKTHDWMYGRLLKNAHMLRCAAPVVVAAYAKSTPHFSGFARLASEHF